MKGLMTKSIVKLGFNWILENIIVHCFSEKRTRALIRIYSYIYAFNDKLTWSRSIIGGRDIIKKGLGWRIGTGTKVRVWSDPWLSTDQPLVPIGPPTLEAVNLCVADLKVPSTNL